MVTTAAETRIYPTDGGAQPLVRLEGIRRHFPVFRGNVFRRRTGTVKAVDGISINIMPGETYSLVGESGCGKTTTSRMLLMADQPTEGNIYFDDRPMNQFSGAERRNFKASVQAVFQDPWSSLNPRMRVDHIVSEPLITHQRLSRSAVRAQVQELLQVVGLHPFHAERYPHEFSGGQRQRIAIARALSTRPKLIVLDEPVSALDVSIRAQILNLLKELQSTYELSYLLIAHNLATVRYMSHTVGVMYLGKIVEEAPPIELFTNAQHPYTRALISASLPAHPRRQREEIVLTGEVPSPLNPPTGCAFHPRCPFVMEHCAIDVPALVEHQPGHATACHLYDAEPAGG
jgi:oligopeptide/dipeptide ABC transporter ATP-binding protein